ncbi:MAG: helix-turn-helix domain-containing protein [Actinomycetota bacterium]
MPSAKDLFGKQLRILRLERHLSQEKLGEKCGYHRNQIGRIERGEQTVSFDGMLQLSHGLQVPPADIWKLVPVQKKLPRKKKKARDE